MGRTGVDGTGAGVRAVSGAGAGASGRRMSRSMSFVAGTRPEAGAGAREEAGARTRAGEEAGGQEQKQE